MDPGDLIEALLQLAARQRAPHARPRARRPQVVEERTRPAGDPQLRERHVSLDRTRPAARTQHQAGQFDRTGARRRRARVEEQRAVGGRPRQQGAAVHDYRTREVQGRDVVPAPPQQLLGRLVEVRRVQAPRQPADLAAAGRPAGPARIVRPEDLGQFPCVSGAHDSPGMEQPGLKPGIPRNTLDLAYPSRRTGANEGLIAKTGVRSGWRRGGRCYDRSRPTGACRAL